MCHYKGILASSELSVHKLLCCWTQSLWWLLLLFLPSSVCVQLSSNLPCGHPSCPPCRAHRDYSQSAVSALSQQAVCYTQQLQEKQPELHAIPLDVNCSITSQFLKKSDSIYSNLNSKMLLSTDLNSWYIPRAWLLAKEWLQPAKIQLGVQRPFQSHMTWNVSDANELLLHCVVHILLCTTKQYQPGKSYFKQLSKSTTTKLSGTHWKIIQPLTSLTQWHSWTQQSSQFQT